MSESIAFVQKDSPSSPLIVLNSFGDEWKHIAGALDSLGVTSYSMLAVTGSEWNKDLSPWDAAAVFKGEPDFTGGADDYLKRLTEEIVPGAINEHGLKPSATYIAGYSMAGLFALYSLYKTGMFDGAASCSGSLWFPGFKEYVFENDLIASPSKIYMSLSDREAKTKNKVMATVEDNTKAIFERYRSSGTDVLFEMNQGGHFTD
ncbi:MAG: alpha/beta hydrolase, partial [Lachnospiraceae bacterium]|nr:alpha/beta hydrolase [Lachnospiraceae bacterium]